ncbi:MAG TPA: hypothetical protein VIL85_17670 [Thermomicrobiales bacterium]|jgi:hypothetical protein
MADQAVPLNEENLPEAPTPQVVILGHTVTRHGGDATATMDLADWEAMTEAEQQAWAAVGADTGSSSEPTTEEIEDRG